MLWGMYVCVLAKEGVFVWQWRAWQHRGVCVCLSERERRMCVCVCMCVLRLWRWRRETANLDGVGDGRGREDDGEDHGLVAGEDHLCGLRCVDEGGPWRWSRQGAHDAMRCKGGVITRGVWCADACGGTATQI